MWQNKDLALGLQNTLVGLRHKDSGGVIKALLPISPEAESIVRKSSGV